MRVLYLAPPAHEGDRLTAFSFLEEELHALSDTGLELHVVVPGGRAPLDPRKIVPHQIPSEGAWMERLGTGAFAFSQAGALWTLPFQVPLRKAFHVTRIEHFIAEVVRRCRIQVIHSNFGWPGGFGGSLAARNTATPLVATFRGMDLNLRPDLRYGLRRDRLFSRALPILLRRATRTTYASEFMRVKGVDLGADPASAHVLHKGVDVELFRPDPDRTTLRRSLGFDRPLVLSVGGLTKLKGVDLTLRALREVANEHPFDFVVCGQGVEEASLRRLASDLGLDDRVHFQGYVPRARIPQFFAAAELLVHSAWIEAAGNVVLEAMASGRPVVTTDSGGPAEYVVSGLTGFVVPTRDPADLARRILQLLHAPRLAETMGSAGRHRAEECFRMDQMIRRIRDMYPLAVGAGETSEWAGCPLDE